MHRERTRRRFLSMSLGAAAQIATPLIGRAHAPERSIALHNLHTGESVRTVFWADGTFVADGLSEIDQVLRDHRTDEVAHIDRELIMVLDDLRALVSSREPYHVISGYRSPKSNAMLRSQGRGVAVKSLHLKGKAVDVRLPGANLAHVRKAALAMQRGGVGYYPKSNFVHLDTGRVRFW